MMASGILSSQIMVITFYAAQKRFYEKTFKARALRTQLTLDLQSKSVDGSQGKEETYVFLDCVTPSAPHYSLWFLKDAHRLCVALSRARDGLVIAGNHRMAPVGNDTKALETWRNVVKTILRAGGRGIHRVMLDELEPVPTTASRL